MTLDLPTQPGATFDDGQFSPERLRRLVERLHEDLEALSCYNFLGIDPSAAADEIRQAFYRRAQLLHPDRYFSLSDNTLKKQIAAVYKRIAESYRILSHPEQRTAYDAQLRRGVLRYAPEEGEAVVPRQKASGEESGGSRIDDPQTRQFYTFGMEALQRQDFVSAKKYFEQARALQPTSSKIRVKLDEVERLQKLYGYQ